MLILGNESKENPKQDLVENHFAIKIKQSEIKMNWIKINKTDIKQWNLSRKWKYICY